MQSVFAAMKNTSLNAFSAEHIRQALTPFEPMKVKVPDQAWSSYFTTYGMLDLQQDYLWSAGLLTEESYDLVAQHYFHKDAEQVRGTIVLVHGYTDHVGIYGHLIRHLLQEGWNVVCFDLPGHGLSSGEGYGINSFDQYSDTLESLLNEYRVQLAGSVVLVGQSTGGAIILDHHRLYASSQSSEQIKHRILLAPLVRPGSYWMIRLQYLALSPFLNRVKRYYSTNSHDEAFLQFIRESDPLQQKWVSVSWVGAMLDWVDEIESAQSSDLKLTVIQGTEDDTVDWQHNMRVIRKLYPQADVYKIEQGRHHLVNESPKWRDQVFNRISEKLSALG